MSNSPEVQATVDAANAAQVEGQRVAEENRAAKVATQEAKVAAQKAEDEQLVTDTSRAVADLNNLVVDNISPDEFDAILSNLQEEFNLTIPTNHSELSSLMEDIRAVQEEAGVRLDMDVYERLYKAGLRKIGR